ncbi:hypothetical protein [uncultured Limosilactobacillus sp.]|uniref:hypothetical protein n=1 Tax=uncultured Limosilactobacillus sp. TaxID=2837629 RepID=UPI0025D50F48|nr:hypothetical protein [uncultured Limosilactobacillus sp.]
MKNAQQKVLTGTVLLMAAFLLGGCASTSTTSTTHKSTSAKVVKRANKSAKNDSKNESLKDNESVVAMPSSSSSSQASFTTSAPQVSRSNAATSSATNYQKSAPTTSRSSDTDVLNSFIAASGLQQQTGNSYLVQNQGNGQYQVEVRHTGKDQDQNVANLTGLYNYNTHNQQVQKMDPVTGQFTNEQLF